ncbi:substrate-binding periplasmic protein [Vogesella oryzae]|uniref:substrate-binding periplasmic protein n=1 Tax=Vogesella oryzae TaxID=1735285 RepID=UPI0015828FF6|nr:transporter substrate-binding domain-containing protein [Vogesella oryzae]
MQFTVKPWRVGRLCHVLLRLMLLLMSTEAMAVQALHYFPAGPIYEYRWKVLELALAHASLADTPTLLPFAEEASQDRAMALLQGGGGIDVIALGVNREREAHMLPVKIDISQGMVGYRVLIIRSATQEQFQRVGLAELRMLKFGLNEAWADVPIMEANGLHVVKASGYENLFTMLAAGRFDAFPRGLNEAARELRQRRLQFPQLVLEPSLALYFPYPIYFWVRKDNLALAQTIERGLKLALADGSMRRLFERYYAKEIAELRAHPRRVFQLGNPVLPEGEPLPDTSWWWRH